MTRPPRQGGLVLQLQSHGAMMNRIEREWPRPLGPGTRASPITIAEVMTHAPHTIGRAQKLSEAHDLMRQHHVRHLPVMDDDKLVGLLSQRDLYFVEALGVGDQLVDKVFVAMACEVYQVAPGDLLSDVAREMAVHKYGCAVVVDRRRVVGIFTAIDALALLAKASA